MAFYQIQFEKKRVRIASALKNPELWGLDGLEESLGDDTSQRVVSSKSKVSGHCGLEMPWSDDTSRHTVSSKSGIPGFDGLEKPQHDDTIASSSRIPHKKKL